MMDPLGLVVLDDQLFLTKVVKQGLEQGIFTRDRADELVRISVAMSNKYVIRREVDFRSSEELEKVQETILKLVGLGLEIKSRGSVDAGTSILVEESPVDLFRLAYTRVSRLREGWRLLLGDHHIEIFLTPQEYDSLDELTRKQLAEMSVFSETELEEIRSTGLEDRLFSTLTALEYYEAELERRRFILKLRDILPFRLLNKSADVKAENLAEVDCLREALVNTLIVSGLLNTPNPVAVRMQDVREFLRIMKACPEPDAIPAELEGVILDLIQELAEGLSEREGELLTGEIVAQAQRFTETLGREWDTVNSQSESIFFKRCARLMIISDTPDALRQILQAVETIDDFDFDLLVRRLGALAPNDAAEFAAQLPWKHLTPDMVISLFHDAPELRKVFSAKVLLDKFQPRDLTDFMEVLDQASLKVLMKKLGPALSDREFSLEDIEVIAAFPFKEVPSLLRLAGPPADHDYEKILTEFDGASDQNRKALFFAVWDTPWFPDLVRHVAVLAPEFLKSFVKGLSVADTGLFFVEAARSDRPRIMKAKGEEATLQFNSKDIAALFDGLPRNKKTAVVRRFTTE
jgi:hypothetical protein